MPKEKTPDFPTISCKTVDDYKTYMAGSPDDNSTIKHNPVPVDSLSLKDLGNMSRQEILNICNKIGSCDNKSDIRIMYCNSLGFCWSDLYTVAEFLGFVNETPDKRKAVFSDPDTEEQLSDNECSIIEISGDSSSYPVEKKLYVSKDTDKKLKFIMKKSSGGPYSNSLKSRILSGIVDNAVDAAYRNKKSGKLKVKIKEQEL